MERVWAPWRVEFIEKNEKPPGCIFCLFPAEIGEEADRKNLILGRTQHSFVILNKFPYTSGHLMVIPRRHTSLLEELPPEEMADLGALLQTTIRHLKQAYGPDGMNVGMNLGRAAGAGIADHLHWHVVPRWVGDTNFMPVIGETRVMIEHLQRTWEKLRPLFTPPA